MQIKKGACGGRQHGRARIPVVALSINPEEDTTERTFGRRRRRFTAVNGLDTQPPFFDDTARGLRGDD